MISLIIPPKDQVSRAAKMLAEEFVRAGLASSSLCVANNAGYCLQHQVSCQSSLRPFGYYLDTTASEIVFEGPPKW